MEPETQENPYAITITAAPVSAPTWRQVIVQVNDGSTSMNLECDPGGEAAEANSMSMTKAESVDVATRGMLSRLQAGGVSRNFKHACISFNDVVTNQTPVTDLVDLEISRSWNPTAHGVGGTNISSGLEAALNLLEQASRDAAASEVPYSAVVLLMSDGEEMRSAEEVKRIADQLKQMPNTSLAACLFATKNQAAHGEPLLMSIVSEMSLYQRVYDAEQLRRFFMSSITNTQGGRPGGR